MAARRTRSPIFQPVWKVSAMAPEGWSEGIWFEALRDKTIRKRYDNG